MWTITNKILKILVKNNSTLTSIDMRENHNITEIGSIAIYNALKEIIFHIMMVCVPVILVFIVIFDEVSIKMKMLLK